VALEPKPYFGPPAAGPRWHLVAQTDDLGEDERLRADLKARIERGGLLRM